MVDVGVRHHAGIPRGACLSTGTLSGGACDKPSSWLMPPPPATWSARGPLDSTDLDIFFDFFCSRRPSDYLVYVLYGGAVPPRSLVKLFMYPPGRGLDEAHATLLRVRVVVSPPPTPRRVLQVLLRRQGAPCTGFGFLPYSYRHGGTETVPWELVTVIMITAQNKISEFHKLRGLAGARLLERVRKHQAPKRPE